MPDAILLQVETPFVCLDIHGPVVSRWGTLTGNGSSNARLRIETTAEGAAVTWTDADNMPHTWSRGEGGPRFFEDTEYRLRARSLESSNIPVLAHRDPALFRKIDQYQDTHMCSGTFTFRRQVGLSAFEIRVGNDTLRVTVEVFPAKLDYESDYQALLRGVASASRGLALEYLRATFRTGGMVETDHGTGLEWITLLRNEIEQLDRSTRYINEHPQRVLVRDVDDLAVEKIKRVNPTVRRAVNHGRGRSAWKKVPGIGSMRSILPTTRNQDSLDTQEHRWLRLNLTIIRDRLSELHAALVTEISDEDAGATTRRARVQAEERELAAFIGSVERLLALPVFTSARGMPSPGFVSLTLLGGIGYRDTYQAIMALRLGLDVEGTAFNLSVMDVNDLYEAWCFIRMVRMVATLTGGVAAWDGRVHVEETGIRVRLQRGQRSAIKSNDEGKQISVLYTPRFSGLTGEQRPDIVIRIEHEGWPALIVVLDAKYRVDAGLDYRKRFGAPGPPIDAINALHRYRDAIVIESVQQGLERPVVKGVALFPLNAEASSEFASSRLFQSIQVLGIGALPFLPDNVGLVEQWLAYLLALSPEDLAEAGPPYSGLAEKQRRERQEQI